MQIALGVGNGTRNPENERESVPETKEDDKETGESKDGEVLGRQ